MALRDRLLPKTLISSQEVRVPEMALGYLVAPFCAMVANAVFGSYLNRYYVDVLGWTRFGAFATLLPIVSSILVIAGNLYVGSLIDRTRTSAGKARPYLIAAAPLAVVAIVLLLMTPREGSAGIQMLWIALTYNLYYAVAYPCYFTAHSSLVALSTRDQDKRGILATLSNASSVAAAGIGASVLAPILLQPFMFVAGDSGSIDVAASYANWRILSIAFALVTAAGIMLEYLFTRERVTEEGLDDDAPASTENRSVREHIAACTGDRTWRLVMLFVLVFQFGQLCKNASMSFYCRWMFDAATGSATPEAASAALMSAMGMIGGIPAGPGMLIAWPLAKRIGKRHAIMYGLIFALAGGLVAFLNVNSFPVVAASVVLKAIGIIPAQFVLLALISDVLDRLEEKNGFRSDGFTMSLYSSVMVGLGGLGTGIINGMLTFSGYSNVGYAVDPATNTLIDDLATWAGPVVYQQLGGTGAVLALAYLGIDVISFAISILLLRRIDLD